MTPSTSSLPKGAPWVFSVPAKFGEPNPIIVLHAIKDGFFDILALSIALDISSKLWPSIFWVCQPLDLNLDNWLVDVDKLVLPSIEILLSSQKTINLESFRWPAKSIASWLIPSCKQPSPTTVSRLTMIDNH